jgi:ectoine hydroxylase-related dioxygenase (phytanoyl-CoA dioxygenase family)
MATNTFSISSDFRQMTDFFHTNGYIIVENAISPDVIAKLKNDLLKLNSKCPTKYPTFGEKPNLLRHQMHKCFFENSPTMVEFIEKSRLVDLIQFIIADVPNSHPKGNSLTAHLIHNNAFVVPPKGKGQAAGWHVDDPLQNIILPPGMKLPPSVKLPVLVCTAMLWLSDCIYPENGPTYVVPTSHRSGQQVDPNLADKLGIPMCGKAGTAVLINSQTWHRGCENTSTVPRQTVQMTFGRRMIGHKFKSIMNYHMPDHITKNKSDDTKARFGFLQGGAYS